jgi:signal transduction histidine kinase
MLVWFSRLPLTLRLPLVVAVMIFVVAVATTQVALYSMSNQFQVQVERIGQVYLDGLAAALMPALEQNDLAAVTAVLQQALTVQVGVQDRRLAALNEDGKVVAWAAQSGKADGETASRQDSPDWPAKVAKRPQGILLESSSRSVWVWRPLPITSTMPKAGTILANLDVAGFISERQRLRWSLLLFDLVLSGVCALVGFFVARQLQRPVALLTDHLNLAAGQLPRPVAEEHIPTNDPQTSQLIMAFNKMAVEARHREVVLGSMMDHEREAILGRLAATLAHEIRNPLGGISTAIQTLRKFGDQPEAREEALDFIERGVAALQEVTDATLKTHRPAPGGRSLGYQDLRDVQVLVAADAARRKITVELDAELPREVPVAATEIRQLLLNLLLNAVNASSPGGKVILRARQQGQNLELEVLDQGPGLSPELASGLMSGFSPPGNGGLGVAVIVRLVDRLQGRVSVTARSEGGTHITLEIPMQVGAPSAGSSLDERSQH